jgi:hypothetical protein
VVAGYIAQAAFQALSGLAKDQAENVFHFVGATGEATGPEAAACILRMADFYLNNHGADLPITNWYSGEYPSVTFKVYDLAAAKPRPILAQASATLPGPAAGEPMPEEVALCLSYFGTRNIPRHRGRIYLGPFSSNCNGTGTGSASRPVAPLVASIVAAGTALAVIGDGADSLGSIASTLSVEGLLTPEPVSAPVSWVLYSTLGEGTKAAPEPDTELIVHGWVDDEWDGQHRRRIKASTRTTF